MVQSKITLKQEEEKTYIDSTYKFASSASLPLPST